MSTIETNRLILRQWQKEDIEVFARINQDPQVMQYFPALLSIEETAALIEHIHQHFLQHGFGPWAATLKPTGELVGFVGLNIPSFEAHFTPCVEILWRLGSEHWGRGYATEAAKEVIKVGFEKHGVKEIVAFTVPANKRSIRVMEKIGMVRDSKDDFYHPKLAPGHPLSKHVLYRILRPK